jgi:hypothetical protein
MAKQSEEEKEEEEERRRRKKMRWHTRREPLAPPHQK